MDADEDARQIKLLGIGVLMFCLSLYFSWTEMRYLIWSHEATAEVVNVEMIKTQSTKSGESESQRVKYAFTDAGGKRHEQSMTVSPEDVIPPQGKIVIRYLATDPPVSRLADDWNWFAFVLLAGSTFGLGWFLRVMHRAANA